MFNTRLSDSLEEEPHFSESRSLELVGCEFYAEYPGRRVGVDCHWGSMFQRPSPPLKNWELKNVSYSCRLKALQSTFFPFPTCSSEKFQVMRKLCGKIVRFLERMGFPPRFSHG